MLPCKHTPYYLRSEGGLRTLDASHLHCQFALYGGDLCGQVVERVNDGILGRLDTIRLHFDHHLGCQGVWDTVARKDDGTVQMQLHSHHVAQGVILVHDGEGACKLQLRVLLENQLADSILKHKPLIPGEVVCTVGRVSGS